MRKVNYLLTILFAIIITSLLFNTHNWWSREKSRHLNIVNVEAGIQIDLDIGLSTQEVGKTNFEFMEVAKNFLEENDLDGYISGGMAGSGENLRALYYYTTPNPDYFEYTGVRGFDDINDVFEDPNWVISNNKESQGTYLLDYIDGSRYSLDSVANLEMIIMPIEEIYNADRDLSNQIFVKVSVPPEDEVKMTKKMEEAFKDFGHPLRNLVYSADKTLYADMYPEITLASSLVTMPYSIIWLSLLVSLFLSIYISISATKEFIVGYLNGFSVYTILRKHYIPIILINSMLFTLTSFITSYILADSHGKAYFNFLKTLYPFIVIYFIMSVLSALFSYFYLKNKFSSQILKQTHQTMVSFYFITLFKVLLIFVIMIPFVPNFEHLTLSFDYFSVANKQEELLNSMYVSFTSVNLSDPQYQEASKQINELVSNNRIGYYDAFTYSLDVAYPIDDYPIEYAPSGIYVGDLPYITINHKFATEAFGFEGKSSDKLLLLAPNEKSKRILSENNPGVDIEVYEEKHDFLTTTHGFAHRGFGVISNPVIIIDQLAFSKQPSSYLPLFDYNDRGDMVELLKEIEQEHGVAFDYSKVLHSFDDSLAEKNKAQNLVIELAILYLTLFPMFVYTATKLYVNTKSKQLIIHYMNGYDYFKRYWALYAITLGSTSIGYFFFFFNLATGSSVNLPIFITMLFASLLLDIIIVHRVIDKFEKHNAPTLLKGDL